MGWTSVLAKRLLLPAACCAVVGCSLKTNAVPSNQLQISLPNKQGSRQAGRVQPSEMGNRSQLSQPQALSDFSCYGVQVTGPGITDDSRFNCSPPGGIGMVGGLVGSGGGTVNLTVPNASSLNIVVFALTSSGGCGSMDSILSESSGTRFTGMGYFYEVGETTASVNSDTTVSVDVDYDPHSSRQLFQGCSGWPSITAPFYISQSAGGPSILAGGLVSGGSGGGLTINASLEIGSPIYLPATGAVGGTGATQVSLVDEVSP